MMSSGGRLASARIHRDYNPVPWMEYFDEAHDIEININHNEQEEEEEEEDSSVSNKNANEAEAGQPQQGADGKNGDKSPSSKEMRASDSFRVYMKNFQEPFAPKRQLGEQLEANKLLDLSSKELENYSKVPTLVTLHGGGYSGLTWAQFARHIVDHCQCRILSIDLRSHGDTKTLQDDQMDISTLVSDVISVTHAAHQICGFPQTPKLVLIGHSMGGAIAVNCASKCESLLPSLAGFVVIDVVEGTAKDALPQMMSVIKTRPIKFPTLSNAIEWSVRSGMAKNSEAARVSMPGNLVSITTGLLAIHDVQAAAQLSGCGGSSSVDGENKATTYVTTTTTKLKTHKHHISADQLIGPSPHPALLLPHLPPVPSPRVAALRGGSSTTAMLPPPAPPTSSQTHAPQSLPPTVVQQPQTNTTTTFTTTCTISNQRQTIDEGDEGEFGRLSASSDENISVAKHDTNCAKQLLETTPSDKKQESTTTNKSEKGSGGTYNNQPSSSSSSGGTISSGYSWRTNLSKTQPYWNGWFDGLSDQLLNAPVQGKFLLLAGIDRLDKTLTIGQMQGKFMMKVLPKCGHAVHEDVPEQVAQAIGEFLVRNKFTTTPSSSTTI